MLISKPLSFFILLKSIGLGLFQSFDVITLLLFKSLLALFLLGHNGFEKVPLTFGRSIG
jgi:hypothetical protein